MDWDDVSYRAKNIGLALGGVGVAIYAVTHAALDIYATFMGAW